MKKIVIEIFQAIKKAQLLVIIGIAIFIIGILLGITIEMPIEISDVFVSQSINFYINVFSIEFSAVSLLFSRLFNYALLLVVVGLLCLNKYLSYLNYIILLYRAFLLGVALKTFLCNLLVIGAIIFLFFILVQAVFLCASILIFMAIMNLNNEKTNNCTINLAVRSYIVCIIIAGIGALIEFLLIVMLFRPLNFCF